MGTHDKTLLVTSSVQAAELDELNDMGQLSARWEGVAFVFSARPYFSGTHQLQADSGG